MSDLRIFIGYVYEKDLWIAAVMRGFEIMTLGFEETQEKAREWGKKAIEARAWEGENKDPPDYYERKKQ
jgi:hypothetical protein